MERRTRSEPNHSRNKRVEASSRSSGQLLSMRKVLERPYLCNACGKGYAQPQGVTRHYRAKHDPSSCTYCGAKWSRRYLYRDHISKEHPDIDPDLVLGKAPESRCKATAIGRKHPSAIKHDRRTQDVSLRPSLTPSASVASKATHAPSTFSSTGENAKLVNNVVDHTSRLPPTGPGGPNALGRSSCAVAHTPTPLFVGQYYNNLVTFDPIIEPSGVMHPYPFSVASYDQVWTNTFGVRSRPHKDIDPRRRRARLNRSN